MIDRLNDELGVFFRAVRHQFYFPPILAEDYDYVMRIFTALGESCALDVINLLNAVGSHRLVGPERWGTPYGQLVVVDRDNGLLNHAQVHYTPG